jgi:3-oxoacyl-[acyl-carrier protein] reductase
MADISASRSLTAAWRSMTKGAIASLVRGIAIDLGQRGITINNMQPGPTLTDIVPAAHIDTLTNMLPVGRLGQPEEIPGMVASRCWPCGHKLPESPHSVDDANLGRA